MLSVQTEGARLDALHQLNLLDTPPSESFDRITRMAARIFDLPIAAVSLTDKDRQWFKSRVGVAHTWLPREKAPCAQVAEETSTLVIPDLAADLFYADSPLAASGVRFYAGVPLVTREGFGLGSLCVLSNEPRGVSQSEMSGLEDLAGMVISQIELQHAFGRIDPLSGLPNRRQFIDDLEDLGRDAPGERRLAVLVDLARSEQLNDGVRVMGSAFIDDLVHEAARCLRSSLPGNTTAYHVGATGFAFIAPPGAEDLSYAAQLRSLLKDVGACASNRFAITVSIGIAPFVLGEVIAGDVLRTAYSAAEDGRAANTSVSLYSAENDSAHARRFGLLNAFGTALEQPGQLRLVYQPRIDLASRRAIGAEALLRWRHPNLGEVSPGEFIPIIERTTLVKPTTAWVLDAAIAQLAKWNDAGLDLQLSVNISAANLEEEDFAERVQLHLLRHRVRPGQLELEVTESAVMGNADRALVQLEALAEAGIRIAIDDFGTGYSSLAYLQRLPADVVKIDQAFVRDLDDGGERARTLVGSMITLSQGLGYRVVAEGVETAASADLLATMGCDEAQGYLFARPLEQADFAAWMKANGASEGAARAA